MEKSLTPHQFGAGIRDRGYTPGSNGFDAIIIGFYRGDDFIYAG